MADWKSPLRADPSEWLVLNASAPIKYRLLTELHSLTIADPNVAKVRAEVLKWPAAKGELRYQRQDGTWGGRITAGDPKKPERTTEKVLWCLYELAWDREVKEIRKSAKTLKSLLAVSRKEHPLFEFKAQVKQDPIRERHAIWVLKIVALGLLLRGGYGDDRKHLDGVADLLDRVGGFVADPVSRHPVEHVGVGLPQIRREAMRDGYCFIPDLNALRVFAHCPALLEAARVRNSLKHIFDYVLSPEYRDLGPELGAIRTVRGIQLRPIEEYLEQGNLDELLYLLEQFARLGLINRYPQLMAYIDWLLQHQEKDGRWDIPQKHFGQKPLYATWTRVEKDWKSPQRRIADVTFRMLVILKYQWERQIKMLDRGADMYGY